MLANEITGANAGGPSRVQIVTLWAARIAQFWRSADAKLWMESAETEPPSNAVLKL
jgi:hypothetical protein